MRKEFVLKATKVSNRSSIDVIRMSMHVFNRLCDELVVNGGLKRIRNVEVDEMVVMFLYTMGHNVKNRILQKEFARSGKTICAVIHAVLQSILNLHEILYVKPVPVKESTPNQQWRHFKVCKTSYLCFNS